MVDICPICEGSGLRVVERPGGLRVAEACECRAERRLVRMIEQARIPQRYAQCTLDDYETRLPNSDRSQQEALMIARNFVRAFPLETGGNGLLITGSIGVGKTHLAVGLLKALITERGAHGLFVDYRDLLKQVQNSYNRNVDATELSVLQPVFDAEVLVLDELGASKPTDWMWDTVAHILNTRYNDQLTTIITTNYPNLAAGKLAAGVKPATTKDGRDGQEASRDKTLGDQIGDRMLSRLQEMCRVIEIYGADFRQGTKRDAFRFSLEK